MYLEQITASSLLAEVDLAKLSPVLISFDSPLSSLSLQPNLGIVPAVRSAAVVSPLISNIHHDRPRPSPTSIRRPPTALYDRARGSHRFILCVFDASAVACRCAGGGMGAEVASAASVAGDESEPELRWRLGRGRGTDGSAGRVDQTVRHEVSLSEVGEDVNRRGEGELGADLRLPIDRVCVFLGTGRQDHEFFVDTRYARHPSSPQPYPPPLPVVAGSGEDGEEASASSPPPPSVRAFTRSNPPRTIWIHPYLDPEFIASIPDSAAGGAAPGGPSAAEREMMRARREAQDARTGGRSVQCSPLGGPLLCRHVL